MRPARRQVDAPAPAPDPFDRERASHRCVPARDGGATLGNAAAGRVYACILFARGACHRGPDCMFLHRAPTAADEEAAEKDVGQDVFGRPRSSLPPDDHTGTGALVRECRALYLNWGKGAAPPGVRHTVEAEARAFGPVLRTHVMAEAPVAFVEFETRASAEFAKEALSRLKLSKGETVFLTETPEGYTLTPYDPALEEEIEAGRAFMREYRDTFHQLAK